MSFAPFLVSFGLNAAGGLLETFGSQQAAAAEAAQRNSTLQANYIYDLNRYAQETAYRNQIYDQQVKQYEQQVQFNNWRIGKHIK